MITLTHRQVECLDFVFKMEGKGKVLKDVDGITRWGICSKFYPDEDIANMDKERASFILLRDYWPSELTCPVDIIVFDASVNCGTKRSIMWLQSTINGLIPRDYLKVDGVLGPITKKAIEFCDEPLLVLGLLHRRLLYYHNLRRVDSINYQGWIGRVIDLMGWIKGGCFNATFEN